jgi:Cd2+/Zn2+-exporting ATPase
VVACPCALVISTPVTFVSAITRATRDGVLVKGGAYLDIASRVTTFALDKTGTLTCGTPSVTEVYASAGHTQDEILSLAASLESASTHPLARAVCEAAADKSLKLAEASDVSEVMAQGMSGTIAGAVVTCGKPSLANVAPSDDFRDAYERICNTGASALVVSVAGELAGIVGVADTLRENATEAIRALREDEGVATIEMLTGDNETAATAIGREAGVTHAVSGLLPGGKVAYVKDMQGAGATVAFVGDGINDAPALATADLGITMGAAASDTALEVADIALLSDDLSQLPRLMRLARRTMATVRVNIGFAIAVKAIVLALVVAGMAGMGAAVFADTGVALLVILNGMRLML